MTTNTSFKNIFKILGPGLLFAGAAVGVSHLVQATKAGATYGFELVWAVLLVLIMKYPFFEFGPRYAMSAQETLVEGYAKQGKGIMTVFVLMTVLTMFTIQGAVTIVTAALASSLFGITSNLLVWSAIILAVCLGVLTIGKYRILDSLMKIIIITLTLSTLAAIVSVLLFGKEVSVATAVKGHFEWNAAGIGFLIALMGWMPAPIDLSVWSSIWSIEKKKITTDTNLKTALLDFNIGYMGTSVLALCFLALGALVMYGSGETLSPKGAVFAGQLISLYTESLGAWAKPLIAVAAFTTMFSTTLTCLDAFPRVLGRTTVALVPKLYGDTHGSRLYWIWILVTAFGALILLAINQSNTGAMGYMINLATILSFLTAPVWAILNLKLVTSKHTPEYAQPPKWLLYWSWLGLVFLVAFCVVYLLAYFKIIG